MNAIPGRGTRLFLALPLLLAGACGTLKTAPAPVPAPPRHAIIPVPMSVALVEGDSFRITAATTLRADTGEVGRVAEHFARMLRTPTGFAVPVSNERGAAGGIALRLVEREELGDEGYRLEIARDSMVLVARRPAGLFRGVQTIRQLLPYGVEAEEGVLRKGPWTIPAGVIEDRPRFAWRGAMLDVARHFFTVDEVKQYIDGIALYKMNVLHLHLSDDQGWRIAIESRPRLTAMGALSEVGGGEGGFYTQREYAEIVRYAAERYITVVPEIDMPGHTNAALVAHPELSCGTRPPAPYTGIAVGFSALCVDREDTYALVDDVVREVAALTPGPYLHVGGDEVKALAPADYARFIERVQGIVSRHGKGMIGWEEVVKARLQPATLVQQWRSDSVGVAAVRQGVKLVLSPSNRVYLDMKYTPETEPGLAWAGHIEVRDAYDWDPATFLPGVAEANVAGVEAPIWTETLPNLSAVQYMAFPRIPAVAEIGWSPAAARSWDDFRLRLSRHTPRWRLMGINYYRSPQIP